jgi:hypothetical protein
LTDTPDLSTTPATSRDDLLEDLRTARAAQRRLRMQMQRAAVLCGTAVVLLGLIATVVAGRRDFEGRYAAEEACDDTLERRVPTR